MGAIVGNNKNTGDNRLVGTTAEKQKKLEKERRNKRDREIYKNAQAQWKEERTKIDGMDQQQLHDYIKKGIDENLLDNDRIGMLTMKINPWEYALISLTKSILGYKSIRQAITKLCLYRVNIWTGDEK